MPSLRARWTAICLQTVCLTVAICLSVPTLLSAQGTTGRILGRIADPSGAVIAGVKVKLVNEATSISRDSISTASGDYDFVEIPVGTYRLEFDLAGFKKNVRRGVALDVNQVITLNMTMQLGENKEVVDVTSEAPLVETTSTQLGAVVDDRTVSTLPLNSRDTYQFLQLQPGVMSTVGSSNSIIYGSDSAGAVSVNGGRGRSNNFSVNGGDANDLFVNLPTVQPTPDSIQEFRVLTNTFDAEYGRNSGSVVNVVTKSGTNQFHGNMYEFFRNKVLNAQGYFDTIKPQFNQNQFGGTFGGPIKKDRTFFFASYEGRRIRQGVPSPVVTVPTLAERPSATQPFADFTDAGGFSGSITSDAFAQTLNNRPGCVQALGAPVPLPSTQPNQATPYSSIFTTNQIPLACMDPTAVDILQFVPTPTNGGNTIQTVPTEPIRGDQLTVKIDHKINEKQNLSIYYYFNDDRNVQPFSFFELAGADVPGFGSIVAERFQQWNISHTWTLNNSTVNEFRFNYNREGQRTFQHPVNTELVQDSCPPPPSWLTTPVPCFSDGTAGNATGIHPGLGPTREGLPFISISGGFSVGNNSEGELPQVGNSFQWSDNLTKVSGAHTFKFGGDVRRQRFDQTLFFNVSGEQLFFGGGPNDTGSGNLYPNYLLGLPDQFGEGSAQSENVRSTAMYLFAQDSWKVKPNITLNYGLRWEFNTPIADISHHVQTFRPGQSSTVYPCVDTANTDCASQTPIGLVVPGDAGVPAGLTQTYYKAFAPRIGIAWSPGNSGKTSFRAGWGMFYNPIEQLVLEQFGAEPPFGGSIILSETQFNTPFVSQDALTTFPNPFNGIITPKPKTPQDWGVFEPILLFGDFQPHMRTQFSDQYNLTIERQLRGDMKLEVGYVGSQGHRLLATHDVNFSNPQTCLDINSIVGAGTCGQFLEDSVYSLTVPSGFNFHMPNGSIVTGAAGGTPVQFVGLRPYSSPQCITNGPSIGTGCPAVGVPVFTSVFAQDTIANSAYNSMQVSVDKRFRSGLQFTGAYTFSKSIDEASSFEGILNPLPGAHNRALSLFDARHRFVLSYYWQLPVPKYAGFTGKLLDGWALSGITTYQTGFPIRITSSADNELMNSFDFELPGEPDQLAPFKTQKPQNTCFGNPLTCNYYFNPQIFTENTGDPTCGGNLYPGCFDPSLLGRVGNAPRTICCGPGISNSDIAILKTIPFNESKRIEFRAELFNVFNHTQFFNPDGNSTDGAQFGQVTQAKDPRLVQFALKFFF